MVVGRGLLRPDPTSRGARLSRHAAPEPPPPTRAVGATATGTPAGDRRGARAWLLLALSCAALLVAAPVAIVMSPTSSDAAGREAEVYTPPNPDGEGSGDASSVDDGGTGAVEPTAAPPPDGAVPPVPVTPGLDPAASTGPADPAAADPGPAGSTGSAGSGGSGWMAGSGGASGNEPRPGGGSGWTQPGTSRIPVLPSSPPASSNQRQDQQPAQQQPSSQQPTQQQPQQPAPQQSAPQQPAPQQPAPQQPPRTCGCDVDEDGIDDLLDPLVKPLEPVLGGVTKPVTGLLGG